MSRILIGCEFSGIVRDAFLARGHDAWSCDLLPTEVDGPHIQGDVLNVLEDGWDLMVAHPPCTYLSRAGARWWRKQGRNESALDALAFVLALWNAPIERVAIENPIGRLNRLWRYPDQVIEPYHFGDPYTKRTCLWLRGVPPLLATVVTTNTQPWLPSNTSGFRRGQRSRGGVVSGGKDASRTFPGVANAMADQVGRHSGRSGCRMTFNTLHAHSTRRCISYGCNRIPEPRDERCMVCQLGLYVPPETSPEPTPVMDVEPISEEPAPCLPWQVRVGREGALTGRVPVVKGRLVQAWAPRIARGLEDF